MEWFRRWVMEGYSIRQLTAQSGHSPRKLYSMISHYLDAPPLPAAKTGGCQRLIFDGTFLHRPLSLVALMDALSHTVIAGKYGISERSEPQIRRFLDSLGLRPQSFTIDGNPKVMRAIRTLWPDALVQRCLVHIQRQGLSWCRAYPKTTYARKLRDIFLRVTHIHTASDRDKFLRLFEYWENKYGLLLSYTAETGPVFSDIKRARSMLLRALPDMFHYLDDPLIPNSTNGLESYFSRLKAHYRQHRGLSKERRPNYFAWYFHLVPK